ncbi:MAG: hypothetical protein U1E65_11390 [Myxococcota bacterium]
MSAVVHRDTVPAFAPVPKAPRRAAVANSPARGRLLARLEDCAFDSAEARLIELLLELDPFVESELVAAYAALRTGAAGFPDKNNAMSTLMAALDPELQQVMMMEFEAMATEAELMSWTE